jgi:MFS transporter, FHS family, L-fucose permease
VCVIAMGLTVLETVANPYTTVLGPQEYAAFRINFAQTFNGVGWMLGPIVGGVFFYSVGGVEAAHARLFIPYLAVAVVVLAMAAIFSFAYVPDLVASDEYHVDEPSTEGRKGSIWRHPHFYGSVLAQFLYVAAQAGIFSFFINYIVSEAPHISHALGESWWLQNGVESRNGTLYVNEQGAARLQGLLGFGLFFLGRLSGSALLGKLAPHRLLGTYSLVNVLCCAIVVMKFGWLSVLAVFLSFFFMSISFPTIFALGIHGLGSNAKKASAFLVMAIVGGALLPKLMGHVGDVYDMSIAFLVPLVCFAGIAIYGYAWPALARWGQPAESLTATIPFARRAS